MSSEWVTSVRMGVSSGGGGSPVGVLSPSDDLLFVEEHAP